MTPTTPARDCGTNGGAAASLSLPVLAPDRRKVRRSRNGPRRAAVLVLVHAIIAIHIAQWLYAGLTLSPVEPSEGMYTLTRGLLNAGFVFFVLALASTLVFGRFFCGWGCHVVALQDLCGWLMKKCGVHPRPFRSRLLVLAPLGLALYMFVWPTFRREVLQPAFAAAGTDMPAWIGPAAVRPELHTEFFVRDFWATFPAWYVAIPFLAVCGFATVYFLGSKGFCTYGCPYGGFFGPADRVALGRIVVNDRCEHCGHCTAVCTSNVRVHDEVRDFGMVVDPGCMKCMDCVSVCPNEALGFSFAVPPLVRRRGSAAPEAAARRERRFDLSWPGEIAVGAVFLMLLIGFRGFLNQVPLLMAAALAGIGAFAAWKLWSLALVPNVRLQSLQLRYRGRLTRAGWVFAPAAAALVLAGVWGAVVRYHLWRGTLIDSQIRLAAAEYLAPGFSSSEQDARAAERAIRLLERAGPPSDGGLGWPASAEVNRTLSSLHAILRRYDIAERYARRALEEAEPSQDMLDFSAQIMARRGAGPEDLLAVGRRLVRAYPGSGPAHLWLARAHAVAGQPGDAARSAAGAVRLESASIPTLIGAATLLRDLGQWGPAREGFAKAAALDPTSGVLQAEVALVTFLEGSPDVALRVMERALEQEPKNAELHLRKAEMLRGLGRSDEADAAAAEAARLRGGG